MYSFPLFFYLGDVHGVKSYHMHRKAFFILNQSPNRAYGGFAKYNIESGFMETTFLLLAVEVRFCQYGFIQKLKLTLLMHNDLEETRNSDLSEEPQGLAFVSGLKMTKRL
ncbi:uncharacterized protein LOC112517666 [Cynara cardunculus var. scolymus]|uniref:uncharacterized protein LOC112517666 n=1 Tax=Cynara cardunculus var. scolymus TaxID=59895 RepID=UPI000D62512A|nr:uncharacterized protein LOC112517666 [Cynara cardunculus var. scolymus]